MTMHQYQLKQVRKVRLPYYGTVCTDRIIPNIKLEIIIHDNKEGTLMLIDFSIPGDRNVMKKEAEKILKYKGLIIEISAHVECESRSDTNNDTGDWTHFKITLTIPEQHTRKAQN
jgi:hypothetical protein